MDWSSFFTGGDNSFWTKLGQMISDANLSMTRATEFLDGVNFEETVVSQYLGHARWFMGPVLYFTFTSVAVIAVGIQLWKTILAGVGYIKNLLPW